jgi:hypothetical protein
MHRMNGRCTDAGDDREVRVAKRLRDELVVAAGRLERPTYGL